MGGVKVIPTVIPTVKKSTDNTSTSPARQINGASNPISNGSSHDDNREKNPLQSQLDKVYLHWFLLEDDYITAIRKGNTSLLPDALARVNYLLDATPSELIVDSLKGGKKLSSVYIVSSTIMAGGREQGTSNQGYLTAMGVRIRRILFSHFYTHTSI